MITTVNVQLKGEASPRKHYALVFHDAMGPEDFISYRNALIAASKAIVSTPDLSGCLDDEAFWLLQLSEFITYSLDRELSRNIKQLHNLKRNNNENK